MDNQSQLSMLKDYFVSIQDAFEESLKFNSLEKWIDRFGFTAVSLVFFSIVPLIPYVISKNAHRFLTFDSIGIFRWSVSVGSLWLWWPLCVSLSVVVSWTFLRVIDKVETGTRRLSESQLRFAFCYSTVDAITRFQRSGLPSHISLAEQNLDRLMGSLDRMLWRAFRPAVFVHGNIETTKPTGWQAANVLTLGEKFSWFRLQKETEDILNAFSSVTAKLRDRLRDRKELHVVTDILQALSVYLYCLIPNIPEYSEEQRLECEKKAVIVFAQKINALAIYQSERKPAASKASILERIGAVGSWLSSPFSHPNVLACFLAWYVLCLILTISAFWCAFTLRPEMKIDTVVVSTIVSAPIVAAITGVTIGRLRRGNGEKGVGH